MRTPEWLRDNTGGLLISDGVFEARRGTYFTSDHRSFHQTKQEQSMTKKNLTAATKAPKNLVTFTRASETDAGITVTAKRLEAAGFNIDPNTVFVGQRYRAILKSSSGATKTVVLTVNRAKTSGATSTTLYSDAVTSNGKFALPIVGLSRDFTVVSFRAY
jgi:hypothetical protein